MGWTNISRDQANTEKKKTNYMALGKGNHRIRIMNDTPFSRWTHWVQSANSGKGSSINCIGKECPICKIIREDKASKKPPRYNTRQMHSFNVIDRTTGEIKLIDKGNTLLDALLNIITVSGEPTNYDIQLVVGTNSKGDSTYTPIPMPATQLTPAEQALELYDLKEIYKPLTQQQILDLMSGKSYADIFAEETKETNDVLDVDFTNN